MKQVPERPNWDLNIKNTPVEHDIKNKIIDIHTSKLQAAEVLNEGKYTFNLKHLPQRAPFYLIVSSGLAAQLASRTDAKRREKWELLPPQLRVRVLNWGDNYKTKSIRTRTREENVCWRCAERRQLVKLVVNQLIVDRNANL